MLPLSRDASEPSPLVVSADIRSTLDVLNSPLQIPDYQRPYVWTQDNVYQLLQDIKASMEQGHQKYRIGSVILHNNDIVDGQQRITTLAMIKKAFCDLSGDQSNLRCNLEFSNRLSFGHIKENYTAIKMWLNSHTDNILQALKSYIDVNCEFVVIRISGKDSLSLAFKLFDSQNGRGKPLEPYNLLKAYHLRAMNSLSEDSKIKYDRAWELSTRYNIKSRGVAYDILKHLFDEQLYRTRLWTRNGEAYSFTKKNIGEFKGITLEKGRPTDFPAQNRQMLVFIAESFYGSLLKDVMPIRSRFILGDDNYINPFVSINQPIVNGKSFFDYVRTYSEIYKKLFLELDSSEMREFKQFYIKNCLNYRGHWRIGDNYIREAFKSAVMLMFDRFGENAVNEYYPQLYVLLYNLRKQKTRVYYTAVAKYPHEIFSIIENAQSLGKLSKLNDMVANLQDSNKFEFPNYDEVLNSLKSKRL